ncbi:MAG: macro domain-containing protein [Candidatus Latescibacterota bacterium]|nr:MAG: macro domain-containing protein [Candidatus Latescibacterota bacterium]
MKIVLTALDDRLREAWERHCGELDGVEVYAGSILDLECDAVVSPANSFGFMDGGIDLIYSRHFGWHVQERLQSLIRDHHHGELLVGSADIVETDNVAIPFVIAAPTMRVPMVLGETVAPYLAARAVLLLVEHGKFKAGEKSGVRVNEGVKSVAFPGLGTGVGRVGTEVCAKQVRAAIDDTRGGIPFPTSWAEAQERHQRLYGSRVRDLQLEDPYRSQQAILDGMRGRFSRRRR